MSEATIKIIEMIFSLLIFGCAVLYVVHYVWLFFKKPNAFAIEFAIEK